MWTTWKAFSMRSRPVAAAVLMASLLVAGAASVLLGPPESRADPGDLAGRVAVAGGRYLYLECRGSGSPSVILDAGLRARGDVWDQSEPGSADSSVFAGIAAFTRVCVYDRPGTTLGPDAPSRSDPVPMPRTAADLVADLHALAAVSIPGPYVLVGHSTGGLAARLYDSTYPQEVAGMVLVDAISEKVRRALPRKMWAAYQRRYLIDRDPALEGYADLETIDFPTSFVQMRAVARPPLPIPLTVISKGRKFGVPSGVPKGFSKALESAWRTGQRYLVRLLPQTHHVIAWGSNHNIPIQQPGIIINETARIVGLLRSG
jgi:pimeloyl-ACP methyl ester carboxylesterase